MSQLIYSVIASLDGYIADEDGSFDWAVPGEEVLDHITGQLRAVSTYLYGRRMYELMTVWETDPAAAAQSPGSADFARVWQRARKVVFSTTLAAASTSNTTLERAFDPERVARIKTESEGDLTIDGPTIAAHAFRAGLVDVVDVVVVPVMIGGGTSIWPDGVRLELRLLEERRFSGGKVALRYAVIAAGGSSSP